MTNQSESFEQEIEVEKYTGFKLFSIWFGLLLLALSFWGMILLCLFSLKDFVEYIISFIWGIDIPEIVNLYQNQRDHGLSHMLYKTKEGLQKEAFDYCGYYISDCEYETVFAIYNEDTDEYFVILGGYHSKYSIGE